MAHREYERGLNGDNGRQSSLKPWDIGVVSGGAYFYWGLRVA